MHPLLNIAIKAARRAGKTIMHKSYRVDQLRYNQKSARDYVSEVDLLAEREIVEVIREAYPNHAIRAEEEHSISGTDYEWIIDPLDGTTNFLRGVPQFAVSIAVRSRRLLEHGVIYDPVHEELFVASRGSGALLNDRRIRVSNTESLTRSLIGTGIPFRDTDNVDLWTGIFRQLAKKTSGIRRPGSAALDLASVACGRYDGFWESGLMLWDMAAGTLIIKESGGLVSDFLGDQNYLRTGMVVAGNPRIHEELIKIVRQETKKLIIDG